MTHKLVIVKKRDPERDPRVTFFLLFFRSLRLCSARRILKSDWVNLTFAAPSLTFIRGHEGFSCRSCRSCRSRNYRVTLRSRSTFQNLESTTWLAKRGKGMLFSVEQAFVGREEIRAPLKRPAWEATAVPHSHSPWKVNIKLVYKLSVLPQSHTPTVDVKYITSVLIERCILVLPQSRRQCQNLLRKSDSCGTAGAVFRGPGIMQYVNFLLQ